MPRESLAKAQRDRNLALVDAMVLAASADGAVAPLEMEQLVAKVLERPEFEGVTARELNAMVAGSAHRLSTARDLGDILHGLRERLPDHRNRLLAFGLATCVALADRRATREELGLLKTFQAALGISEVEVGEVFEAVESGRSLAEVLGEPLERLYAETMVLVSASDGTVHRAELGAMLENMAGDPAFKEVSLDVAQRYLRDAVNLLAEQGLPQRLTVLAHGLTTHAQRARAYRLAVRVAVADGAPTSADLRVLDLLQATFGLADDEVSRMRSEA